MGRWPGAGRTGAQVEKLRTNHRALRVGERWRGGLQHALALAPTRIGTQCSLVGGVILDHSSLAQLLAKRGHHRRDAARTGPSDRAEAMRDRQRVVARAHDDLGPLGRRVALLSDHNLDGGERRPPVLKALQRLFDGAGHNAAVHPGVGVVGEPMLLQERARHREGLG